MRQGAAYYIYIYKPCFCYGRTICAEVTPSVVDQFQVAQFVRSSHHTRLSGNYNIQFKDEVAVANKIGGPSADHNCMFFAENCRWR